MTILLCQKRYWERASILLSCTEVSYEPICSNKPRSKHRSWVTSDSLCANRFVDIFLGSVFRSHWRDRISNWEEGREEWRKGRKKGRNSSCSSTPSPRGKPPMKTRRKPAGECSKNKKTKAQKPPEQETEQRMPHTLHVGVFRRSGSFLFLLS
jgi:hypothetical protein